MSTRVFLDAVALFSQPGSARGGDSATNTFLNPVTLVSETDRIIEANDKHARASRPNADIFQSVLFISIDQIIVPYCASGTSVDDLRIA